MKKIIAVILTVALLSCAFIIPVSATNSEEHDNRLFYQTFLEKYLRGSDEYLLCYEELYYSKNTNDELEWVFIHARIDGGDSDEYYDDEEDMDFYEVECPGCNEKVYFDEDMINDEVLVCPNCNEKIEIEFDEDAE